MGKSFDYVSLMGYFWDYGHMIKQFKQYGAILGEAQVLFGVCPAGEAVTPLTEVIQLAQYLPSDGVKGGMMEFNINGDANVAYASAINQNMKAQTHAAGR